MQQLLSSVKSEKVQILIHFLLGFFEADLKGIKRAFHFLNCLDFSIPPLCVFFITFFILPMIIFYFLLIFLLLQPSCAFPTAAFQAPPQFLHSLLISTHF